MRNMLVTSAMLAALSSTAVAQELKDDAIKLAANTVSYKFTVCAALQGYNSMCLANQDLALKAKSEEAKKDFLDIALSTATVAGVKIPDIVVTRYRIALKDFQRQTDHNCQNISVLLGRYAAPCKALIQNPEAVLKSHLEKARQTVERSKENPKPPPTAVLPKSSSTTTPEPGAWSSTSQEFKKAVEVEDIKQHPTTGKKRRKASPPARSMQQTGATPLPHMRPRQIPCTPVRMPISLLHISASILARLSWRERPLWPSLRLPWRTRRKNLSVLKS